MAECENCGSKRLRSAPIPLVSSLAALFLGRRRYACPVCRSSGWKRRMRRTDRISVAVADPSNADLEPSDS